MRAGFSFSDIANDTKNMTTIRPELPTDHDAVRAIHQAAFDTPLEARLVDELRKAGKDIVSLVAERDGRIVGHILFSPVSVEIHPAGRRGLGLAPLAVAPEYQRKGIGGELIKSGLDAARAAGYAFTVVLGDPAYYRRFGFATASLTGLKNEYELDDPFMAQALIKGGLKGIKGLVRYAPEFEIFEEQ